MKKIRKNKINWWKPKKETMELLRKTNAVTNGENEENYRKTEEKPKNTRRNPMQK